MGRKLVSFIHLGCTCKRSPGGIGLILLVNHKEVCVDCAVFMVCLLLLLRSQRMRSSRRTLAGSDRDPTSVPCLIPFRRICARALSLPGPQPPTAHDDRPLREEVQQRAGHLFGMCPGNAVRPAREHHQSTALDGFVRSHLPSASISPRFTLLPRL